MALLAPSEDSVRFQAVGLASKDHLAEQADSWNSLRQEVIDDKELTEVRGKNISYEYNRSLQSTPIGTSKFRSQ